CVGSKGERSSIVDCRSWIAGRSDDNRRITIHHPRSTTRSPRFAIAPLVAAAFVFSPAAARAIDPAVEKFEAERVAAVAKVTPAVVAIFSPGGGGGGSGVLVTPDGFALTNFHVTNGPGNFMKCGLSDGALYDAVLVGIDPTGDVAMIKLIGRDDF